MTKVLSGNFTVDGSSSDYQTEQNGTLVVTVAGTWGSGTVTGTIVDDSSNAISAGTSAELTADGAFEVYLKEGMAFRLVLSGSTSPDLDYEVHE